VLALIYLQVWSMLLCTHIYIKMLQGVNTAYGVKGCVSNTVCVITVMHVVTWFYANSSEIVFNEGKMKIHEASFASIGIPNWRVM